MGLIPVTDACIGYLTDDTGGITEVRVMHISETRRATGGEAAFWWKSATYTHGAVFSDWMKPDKRNMTPEFIFSEMLAFYGFANSLVAEQALREFAKIDTCAWARAMVPGDPDQKLQLQWRRIPA